MAKRISQTFYLSPVSATYVARFKILSISANIVVRSYAQNVWLLAKTVKGLFAELTANKQIIITLMSAMTAVEKITEDFLKR